MKLSDFTTEELKQMKQACIDTRAKYDGYRWYQANTDFKKCALCHFTGSTHKFVYYFMDCNRCPWLIFIGIKCYKLGHRFHPVFIKRWRLDRWIKLIDEEILKRSMRSSEAQIGIKPNFE